MKNIEDLKKRLWSRMRNYTDDKKLLKRYMNDLNLLQAEYDKSIKEMIEKVLSILKEGCGVNFVLEEQDCICGDDFEYEDKVKVLLCELCLDKIKRIELLSKIGDNSEVEK